MQVNGFPSPREAHQKVYILGGGRQILPLYHESLGIRMPVVNQGIQQPWLCTHERTQKEFDEPTLRLRSHHSWISGYHLINSLMLSLSPMHIHPEKTTRQKGELESCKSNFGCAGGNPQDVEVTVAGTHALPQAYTQVPMGCLWTACGLLGPPL
jgi:hypothetical protein